MAADQGRPGVGTRGSYPAASSSSSRGTRSSSSPTRVNAAFARWNLSHLHNFELTDGRLIGYPDDSFAPNMVWLDHAKLKVTREVRAGEEFEYVFDFGDNWQHQCTVLEEKVDPVEEYGPIPAGPVAIWGWGSIPDQYGRRWLDDDGGEEP